MRVVSGRNIAESRQPRESKNDKLQAIGGELLPVEIASEPRIAPTTPTKGWRDPNRGTFPTILFLFHWPFIVLVC